MIWHLDIICFLLLIEGSAVTLKMLFFCALKQKDTKSYVGTIDKQEIDFVLEKGGKKRYIQVCYILNDPSVIQREFGNLARISDNYEKTVISLDDLVIGDHQGISHIQAWEL